MSDLQTLQYLGTEFKGTLSVLKTLQYLGTEFKGTLSVCQTLQYLGTDYSIAHKHLRIMISQLR